MRLNRLRLSAFGPFAGSQDVDFDELSAAGLFLLHGPTGAGKTSVLDAVCYALYGQVPGARPANRLRSDHAAPGTPTEVVLELTVGERRLEIIRRPEQARAKKRGSGTTLDKPVTLLRELAGGEWRGLSTSHQEIGEEIKQLVGMSCEQFCQVVLLPQGEFATFLRATATERGHLLGRLFDTRRFTSVEAWLRDRRQEAGQRLARSDEELRQLGAALRQAAGPWAGEPEDDGALLEWAARLRCEAREIAEITALAVTRAEAAHREAATAHAEARDLHALQRRHQEAATRAAALDEQRPARSAARAALDRAHRAAAVEPALSLRDKAATQHAEAAHLASTVLAELAASPDPGGSALPHARPADHRTPDAEDAPGVPAQSGRRSGPSEPAGADGPQDPAADGRGAGGSPQAQEVVARGVDGAVPAARTDTGDGRSGVEPDGQPAPGQGQFAATRSERDRAVAAGPGTEPQRGRRSTLGGGPAGALGEPRATGAAPRAVGGEAAELGRRAGELREVLGGLTAAAEGETRLGEIAGRRASLDREDGADEETAREAQGWLDRWPERRTALQSRVDAGMEGAARAAELAAEVEAARRRVDAAAQRDRLIRESAAADGATRDARDRAQNAREAWQDLREARISGIAAELAAGLVDGAACRVCGSEDHPAPARPAGRQVSRADEDAAEARFQEATTRYEQARDRGQRLAAALEAACAAAGGLPLAELTAEHAASAAAHAAAAARAADVAEARAALDRAEAERDDRAAQRQDALSRSAARTSRREELDEQHERLSRELARARAGHATVAARRAALAARVALLERAERAVRDRAEARTRLTEAEAALADAATRAGFASPAEASAALMPQSRLWAAERQAEAWAKEEAALDAELAAPEPVAAAALPPAEPAAAQSVLDAATRALRQAAATASAAEHRCAELDRLSASAAARVRELAPARAAFDRVRRLADLAAGTSAENRYRMGLETYVLAARLEQVAAAAAVRLQRMSAGRYTLAHSDARGSGRARSGLGLVVVDAWTGTERDTATLSGGETFFASLALALGLADVVTDESGGTRLDTLFIDEGFGSLDDQTLDEVLDVLDGLRERDRAVGIVSHVADLRHRIPAQLRVDKGRDGSAIRLRTGAVARSGA
ncbi:AAA family ATPase [Actinacidiphila acidipaludis]|uniref:Nuclease SbcCD subunit C n=1 Tax=Actinacidiphila acidipaludis TaxID=2873382 RepID=A0ABS7Q8F0_9ACTN|nr:AAA family ATPase [Streptomyces acidipaludis]MBY8878297.1 AAA family ATPase [Streptomyces acidipaludis]